MRQGMDWKRSIGWVVLSLQVALLTGCGASKQVSIQAEDRYKLAQQYLGNRSYLLAEQEVRKALDLAPKNANYFELLALIYQAQGRLRLADDVYQVALKQDRAAPSTHVNYSSLLLQRDRPDEAIAFSQRALQNSGYARPELAHTNIGLAYLKKGNARRAEDHFRTALEYQPSLPEAHQNLGLTYEQAGERAKALLSFRAAIRSRPAYTEAHASLGRLLMQDGRPDEARDAFKRVIDLAPDSELAVASRRQLRRLPLK